jgi:hypothetical protein
MALLDGPELEETRALAIVGNSLVQGLIATLNAHGILSANQTNALFATVLGSLDTLPKPDPGVDRARILLADMAALYRNRPR